MNDGGALCLHRYRSVLIRHMNPNEPLPEDTERIMVGNTVMLPVVAGDGS